MQNSESSLPMISVVVCTYNRAKLLANVLRTLCEQTINRFYYEVIVVNNNSKDNTRDIAEQFCHRYSNVRYCLEREQGLSHARNHGWREAKGEYVAYIDDDCKIPHQFLETAKSIIEKESPTAFGGPAFAFYNSEKPYWYRDAYGSHKPFSEVRVLAKDECHKIFGMNMFLRRSALEDVGGFDPKLGMVGNKVAYCEETALLLHIAENAPDYKFYYDPDLYVYHLVQQERMSVRWFINATISKGRYSIYCSEPDVSSEDKPLILFIMIIKQLRLIFREFEGSVLHRNRTRYEYYQNYIFECTWSHLFKLGKLYEHFLQVKQAI